MERKEVGVTIRMRSARALIIRRAAYRDDVIAVKVPIERIDR